MPVTLTAAHLRSAAARLGWRLGARQALDHVQLTGQLPLDEKPLYAMARLAWKYEAKPMLGNDRDERAFIDCYVTAYQAHLTQELPLPIS